jgi:CubicO group peptidase (beta-lactamase class C family)
MKDLSGSGGPAIAVGDKGAAIARLSAYIPKEMKARGIRGLSVAVADASGTIWSSGFGWADGSGKRAFDAATISNIGSVSKLLTSTAVMRLVQEGKIDLDAPVSRYLPDFKPRDGGYELSTVTVRLLLTHHSGLQSDNWMGFAFGARIPGGYPRPYANNALLASETSICGAPGSVFSYSNLGYSLLGLIVEKASGKDFPSYIHEAILAPLGMDSSSFLVEERFRGRYARGKSGFKKNVMIPYIRDMPAGSFNSSAEDMGRFLAAVIASASGAEGGPLTGATQREMWTRQNAAAALDLDFSIGLAWWLMDLPSLPGERLAYHGGDLDPFHAFLIVDISRSLGVFVMANSAKGLGSFSLGEGIGNEVLRAFGQAKGGPPFAAPSPRPGPAPLPAGLASRLAGSYATPMGLIRVKEKGSTLAIRSFRKWLEGYCRTDGSIGLRVKMLGIELPVPILKAIYLTPESLGGETLITLRTGGIPLGIGRKVEAGTPRPAWLARAGTWVRTEVEPLPIMERAALKVDRDAGLFLLSTTLLGQTGEYPIRTVSDDEAIVEGSGRNLGSSIRISLEGGTEILNVFGVKFRKKR